MKLAVLIAVMPGIGLAFTPSVVVPHASTGYSSSSRVVLAMRETTTTTGREEKNNASSLLKDNLLRPFGAVLVAASLVFNPGSAVGAGIENTAYGFSVSSPVTSSSLQVAEEIKLLDMSLPSYGSISDPKANTDSVGYVKEDKSVAAAAAAAKKKKAAPKAKQSSKVAPEKRKPVAKEPFVKEAVVKRDRSVESEEKIDVRSSYKSKPVFMDKEEVSVEDKVKEKEAKKAERKPAKKEKEAVVVSEEKDDGLSLKDVTIVDMKMPSYDSTPNKKDNNFFAL